MRATLLAIAAVSLLSIGLSGCASISKDECLAGNWSDIGYKDGVNGRARGKLADYTKSCGKYDVTPDRSAYLTAYDQGLVKYCTYEQGFELGENGNSFNQVCADNPASGFAQGYDAGRAVYEIYAEHKRLIDIHEDSLEALVNVRGRLAGDIFDKDDEGNPIELSPSERKRLTKKQYRLEGELNDIRADIRDFEARNDLPRHRF